MVGYHRGMFRLQEIIIGQNNVKKFIKILSNKKNCVNLKKSLYDLVVHFGDETIFTNDKLYIDYLGLTFILVNKMEYQMMVNIDKQLIKVL